MEVSELKGFKSLRALNVFHTLLLGLKMLPEYALESYEDFFARVDAMPAKDKEKMIREAILFVELKEDEVAALITFCKDKNGVPYSSENLKSLGPDEIFNIIVAVCMKIARFKIDFVTEGEKKN